MIEFPAGMSTAPTKASSSAYWRDGNLVRWVDGRLRPLGGWDRTTYPVTASPIRHTLAWRDLLGRRYIAYLCEEHLYVDISGVLTNITPVGGIEPPFRGVGGFGDDDYNTEEYGTSRPLGNREILNAVYSMSNWGEDLLVMTSADGRLLRWSPSTPAVAAAPVPNAPLSCRGFSVTPERFVILYDYLGKMGEFAWCNREDIENWNFADPLGTAGNLPVFPSSPHHSSLRTPGGTLTFSQSSAYMVEYVGGQFIYSARSVDDTGNTPMSDRSIIPYPAGAIFLSRGGVWRFDGVSISPLECPIWNWIKTECNFDRARFIACAVHVANNSEIFFFFPSTSNGKNDRYALYNYQEGWWSTGYVGRSAGVAPSYNSYPLMADETVVYQHEYGASYGNGESLPWIETYAFLGNGASDTTLMQMEPDLEGDFDSVRFRLHYRNKLSRGQEVAGPLRNVIDNRVDFLTTGREIRLRLEVIANTTDQWTLGNSTMIIKGGRRL